MRIHISYCILFLLLLIHSQSIYGQGDNNVHYVQETSRPEEVIAKQFPYDIDLKDADGQVYNTSTLFKKKRKATVLLFWVTTCGPCRAELGAISKKYNDWKKQVDFDFYAISNDFPFNTEQFNTRVKQSNWPFPAYLDFNREFRFVMDGGLNGLPQLFVLDKKGKVIYHSRKFWYGDEDKLFEALKSI
jgi:peroxiredoxin